MQYLKDCELLDFDRLEHEEPLDAETKKEGLEDVEEALAQYQEAAGDTEAAASILSVSHNQHLKCTKIQILTLIFNAPRYQEMKSTS